MEIPNYEPFYLETLDDLRDEIARLGLEIPVGENFDGLQAPAQIGSENTPNRFCQQPLSGNDAEEEGAPGDLTFRRYLRYAEGGFGLIWIDSTAALRSGRPGQLVLRESHRDHFQSLVKAIRESAFERWNHEVVVILQLAVPHTGITQAFPGSPPGMPLDPG